MLLCAFQIRKGRRPICGACGQQAARVRAHRAHRVRAEGAGPVRTGCCGAPDQLDFEGYRIGASSDSQRR
eukprot:4501829-Lingulodinium_polyedra.AAC.1